MKIALFDDHQIILDSLKRFLLSKENIEIIGTATSSAAFIDLLICSDF